MGRRTRFFLPQTILHICNRGAMDMQLFKHEEDYALCQRTLAGSILKHPIRLYAFCIMPNHWHLLIDGDNQVALSGFLQNFSSWHARSYRKKEGTIGKGAVYQNRFRAYPVQRNEAFARVAHYIEYNPVKAGLVVKAQDWKWSSADSLTSKHVPIAPWPIQKPHDWSFVLTQATRGDWVDRINISLQLQEPLGDLAWIQELKASLPAKGSSTQTLL